MTKRNGWITKALSVSALAAVMGGGWVALGGRLATPGGVAAEHVEEYMGHVEDFETHVAVIDTFLARDMERDASRARRALLMETQTRLSCIGTSRDTLILVGLVAICDSLTGR